MKLNLPNRITVLRMLLTPIIIFLYLANFIPYNKIIAAVVFVLAVSTDFFDGKIARKRNMVTNLGKFLDPIADKLINITAIILIAVDNIIPRPYGVLFAILIVSRELIIGALRQIAAANGTIIAADKMGKLKTVLQDIAIPLLIILAQFNTLKVSSVVYNITKISAFTFSVLAAILTVWSLVNYFYKNKHVLSQ